MAVVSFSTLVSVLLCLLTATTSSATPSEEKLKKKEFAVVGYLPEWRYGGANFER